MSAYLVLVGLLSAIFNFIPARILSRSVSIYRVLIGTIYMNAFLQTVSAFLLLALLIIANFSTVNIQYAEVGSVSMPFGDPELQKSYALYAWQGIWILWLRFIAPAFSLTATAGMTGIRARRLMATTALIVVLVPLSVLFVCFLVYLSLGTVVHKS